MVWTWNLYERYQLSMPLSSPLVIKLLYLQISNNQIIEGLVQSNRPHRTKKRSFPLRIFSVNFTQSVNLNFFSKCHKTRLGCITLSPSSLSLHINQLKLLLSGLNLNSDIICISESRITKSNLQTSNVHIPGYNLNKHPQNFLQMVHWFIYLKISSYNLCEISWYSFRWTFNLVSPNLAYPDETQTRNWNTQQGKVPSKHSYTKNCIHSLFGTHLLYACQLWDQDNKDKQNYFQTFQNKALKS